MPGFPRVVMFPKSNFSYSITTSGIIVVAWKSNFRVFPPLMLITISLFISDSCLQKNFKCIILVSSAIIFPFGFSISMYGSNF